MDNRGAPPSEPRKGLLSGRYHDAGEQTPPQAPSPKPPTGGLLARFGGQSQRPPAGGREREGGLRGFAQNLRRMTEGALHRAPRHGDWRATDFAPEEIEDWDHYGDAPFELPPDPDSDDRYRNGTDRFEAARRARDARDVREPYGESSGRASRGRASGWDGWDESDGWGGGAGRDWNAEWDSGDEVQDIDWENARWDDQRDDWGAARGSRRSRGRSQGGRRDDWDDRGAPDDRDNWRRDDGGWGGGDAQDDAAHWNVVGDLRSAYDQDPNASAYDTRMELGSVSPSFTRVARVQMLLRRRPAAAALLAFCLLGFMLTCCAPLAPLVRLGLDVSDLVTRGEDLRTLAAGGATSLINASNITRAQRDIASIEGDLYELNGAISVAGAPIASLSHTARNYQLLVRIGYDLTGAASESLQIAQTLVTPLEGGALSADSSAPGITPADIQQARVKLSDAYARALDAIQAYQQLDLQALPAQLKPGSQYGAYLAQLPLVVKVFGEMKDLLDAAPALLGVGQPAYYLAIAMDRSELRPGGGFQGNYGLLELDGGKQSKTRPFGLTDTYPLDQQYALAAAPNPEPSSCGHQVTLPTNVYWWWPYRCIKTYGWGLRDSNLSPDFPTNARLAIQIVEAAGGTPKGAPIQGVVAFTPVLIENLLKATGNLPMPDYKVVVTPDTLEWDIHHFQLRSPSAQGQDRKQFTHDLSKALLDRIKGLHGAGLKVIFKIAAEAIQSKDLEVYLAAPRAELVLQQLGISGAVATGQNDGFFVVDANDGGNKANLFVTETQTDYVTLLPNGGAYHRLAISVTYDKKGDIFNPGANFDDYSDIQRTYLPGDATIAGWSGFNPKGFFSPGGCPPGFGAATVITDCTSDHGIISTSTDSDVAGRTMVMGALLVMCGPFAQDNFTNYDSNVEATACGTSPQPHTQTIFISWYTPNAYTVDANGHGTYTELVEKQSGDFPRLTVYVTRGALQGAQVPGDLPTFTALLAHAQKIYDNTLTQNQLITYSF